MCRISVIIPIYNVEQYLEKCIDSIINQTFKDIEVICVNDGSTDASLNILEEYARKDNRLIIINQENKGLSAARNTGIQKAQGKYIFFVDSDDYIKPDTLEKMYNKIISTNVDMVSVFSELFYEEEKPDNFDEFNNSWICKLKEETYKANKFLKLNCVAWGKLYKTEIIKKYNLKFDEGLINEDESWQWYYSTKIKSFYYIPEKLYMYRQRKQSIMNNKNTFSEKNLHIFKILENIYEHLNSTNIYSKYKKQFEKYFIGTCCCVYQKTNDEFKEQVLDISKETANKCNINFNNGLYYSFFEKIFSIKNSIDKKSKVLSILGLKLNIKKYSKLKIAVHLHIYYHEQIDYVIKRLKSFGNIPYDLYITYVEENIETKTKLNKLKKNINYIKVNNVGYDIYPYIKFLNTINLKDYDYIVKLHTKGKQPNLPERKAYNWRNNLFNAILKNNKQLIKCLNLFDKNSKIGMIGSEYCISEVKGSALEDNELFDDFCTKYNLPNNKGHFICGTMFICRAKLMQTIKEFYLKEDDFQKSSNTGDKGTLAHVIERILGSTIERNNYNIVGISNTRRLFE